MKEFLLKHKQQLVPAVCVAAAVIVIITAFVFASSAENAVSEPEETSAWPVTSLTEGIKTCPGSIYAVNASDMSIAVFASGVSQADVILYVTDCGVDFGGSADLSKPLVGTVGNRFVTLVYSAEKLNLSVTITENKAKTVSK